MTKIRILYIQPFEFWGKAHFCTEPFLRISNYLNFHKEELRSEVCEEYYDLRIEELPHYWPENIVEYRNALKNLLTNINERFNFDVVAISCYTSFCYLNSIEVAKMIKHLINPSCYIVFGGFHASVLPEDFYSENIPLYFDEYYPKNTSPVDFCILDEGEIPFYRFIKSILNGTIKPRKNLSEKPIILKREILENLDDVPIISLELFKKYAKKIEEIGDFYIQWRRGCQFRCKFCPPSENYMPSYRLVRYKSLEKCMEELKVIVNTKWLKFENLFIVDPMFMPKRSKRNRFFEELDKIYHKISFRIYIFDRIETAFPYLENYKKYNIIPGIGLESASEKLLSRVGKTLGKNSTQINKGAHNFLDKAINIIKYANKIELPIIFFYMLGLPGSDENTLNESRSYFFEKRYSRQGLIERYKINLHIGIYGLLYGSTIYDKGEEMFGAKYYYKHWWKIFDKEQYLYCGMIRPSKQLSFPDSINLIRDFVIRIFKSQIKLNNPFYSIPKLVWYKIIFAKLLDKYEKNLNKTKKQIYHSVS